MYFLVEEEIPCIQYKHIPSRSLEILYRSCPSGKTASPGCSSPGRVDLAVDVVTVEDGDLSDLSPREGSYSCNEEEERDNDSHQFPTHRYPSQ